MDADPRSETPPAAAPGRSWRAPAWLRPVLFGLGCVSVVVGVIGLVLPGVPGAVFLILGAWCFTRSSPRLEAWLLDHPRLGPPVRSWREAGAIPRGAKWFACLSMLTSWLVLWAIGSSPLVVGGCGVLFLVVCAFIVTRPDGAPRR